MTTTAPKPGATPFGPFTLRWEESGDGPALLLLHGIYAGAGRHEWAALRPALEERFRVRTVDLLGFGSSDHPDLQYTPELVLGSVKRLIEDMADRDGALPEVVASSLTAAYVIRAASDGMPIPRIVAITPTGLAGTQSRPGTRAAEVAYAIGRHSPLGDALSLGLSSNASIRWYLQHKAYANPAKVTDAVIAEHHRSGRRANAKHAALAFVAGILALPLTADEVRRVAPTVVWACGQEFNDDRDLAAWRAVADVIPVGAGLPQAEQPDHLVGIIAGTPVSI